MVVAKANLVLVEGRLLAHDKRIRALLVQLGSDELLRNQGRVEHVVLVQLGLGGALEADNLLVRLRLDRCLNDASLEIRADLVFLVEDTVRELDHLLLDKCHLPVVLESVDERLATDSCRETLAWKLDSHVRSKLVHSVELALREEFAVELRRCLGQMQNLLQLRLEDKLSEFIVDFEALLNARVVQMSVWLVNKLDGSRFLRGRTLDLNGTIATVELITVFDKEGLFRTIDISCRFE